MGTDLRSVRPEPSRPESRGWYGYFAEDITSFQDMAKVIVPDFDPDLEWGPCRWTPRDSVTLPNKGDDCMVLFDNRMHPWVASWWSGALPDPLDVGPDDMTPGTNGQWLRTLGGAVVWDTMTSGDLPSDVMLEGDAASGVLSGTYPSPGFAVDMATQAELNTAVSAIVEVPIGGMLDYAGSGDPAGGKWLLADGRLIDRTTYSAFFTEVGHKYNGGVDPGGNQVRIPDERGRVSVGADNMGTARGAAGRLTANGAAGNSGGEEKHTLSGAESGVPVHGHTGSSGNDTPDHAHGIAHDHPIQTGASVGAGSVVTRGAGTVVDLGGGGAGGPVKFPSPAVNSGGATARHTHPITVNNNTAADAASSHNNMQPHETNNKIVRVL